MTLHQLFQIVLFMVDTQSMEQGFIVMAGLRSLQIVLLVVIHALMEEAYIARVHRPL